MRALGELGVLVRIYTGPVEVVEAIPFEKDIIHAATTRLPFTASGARSYRPIRYSRCFALGSLARRARFISSGAPSTLLPPVFRGERPPGIPEEPLIARIG